MPFTVSEAKAGQWYFYEGPPYAPDHDLHQYVRHHNANEFIGRSLTGHENRCSYSQRSLWKPRVGSWIRHKSGGAPQQANASDVARWEHLAPYYDPCLPPPGEEKKEKKEMKNEEVQIGRFYISTRGNPHLHTPQARWV